MAGIGVTFINADNEAETYHSYDTFGLILESTELSYPEAKTETIDIPGRDGLLDLTGILTGEVKFYNRTLILNFVDLNDKKHYSALAGLLSSFLFGKKLKIILDKDKSYYYLGRIVIDSFDPVGKTNASTITVECDIEPFKYSIESTADRWKWDPFNFYTGVITSYGNISVNGTKTVTVYAGDKSLSPEFVVTGNISLVLRGEEFQLGNGRYYNNQIILRPKENVLTFRGNGTVTIDFRRRAF